MADNSATASIDDDEVDPSAAEGPPVVDIASSTAPAAVMTGVNSRRPKRGRISAATLQRINSDSAWSSDQTDSGTDNAASSNRRRRTVSINVAANQYVEPEPSGQDGSLTGVASHHPHRVPAELENA